MAEVVGEVRLAATGELLSHVAAAANRSALEIAGLSPGEVSILSVPIQTLFRLLFFGCYSSFSARIMDISRSRSPGDISLLRPARVVVTIAQLFVRARPGRSSRKPQHRRNVYPAN